MSGRADTKRVLGCSRPFSEQAHPQRLPPQSGSKVSDAGLAFLAQLPASLQYLDLNLGETKVSDAGIAAVLPQMNLGPWGTTVADAALVSVESQLPVALQHLGPAKCSGSGVKLELSFIGSGSLKTRLRSPFL